jgi:uncharacterized delta-60 repeat protein
MPLITRQAKGSKLTIQEMDGNLIYLQGIYNDAGNSSENTSIDWSNGTLQELNIDDDPTLTFSNGVVGQTSKLLLKQQLNGLRTITWPNDVVWNGGLAPTLQTLSPAVDPGDIDTSFVYGAGFNNTVQSIATQSDGKILVIGGGFDRGFTSYDGTPANRIIRLNTDGSVDNTFVYGAGFNNPVQSIATQSDGKILVGGGFTSYDGTGANCIIRLNANGSVDNTFVYGAGFNNPVQSIATQSDGKILVGGGFTSYDGTGANCIIRLNANGSVDNTFVYGTGFNSNVISVVVQSDGKILVCGNFTSYDGTGANRIIRLNANGSVDNTFVYGTGFSGTLESITIQSDGKIMVGGDFTSYNGTTTNRIIRLNSDGSVDNTFVTGTGFDSPLTGVLSISLQSDGKILVGGGFANYNGTSANGIVRLNTDGSADETFATGTGFDSIGVVTKIGVQSDGKIMVGGYFTSYDGTGANHIIRLISTAFSPLASYNTVEFDYNGTYYIGSY